MDTRYRIYTEGGPRREARARGIVGQEFDGFNVQQAEGVWRGVRENSIIIEIIGEKTDRAKVLALAERIRGSNDQMAVLFTAESTDAVMLTATVNPDVSADVRFDNVADKVELSTFYRDINAIIK